MWYVVRDIVFSVPFYFHFFMINTIFIVIIFKIFYPVDCHDHYPSSIHFSPFSRLIFHDYMQILLSHRHKFTLIQDINLLYRLCQESMIKFINSWWWWRYLQALPSPIRVWYSLSKIERNYFPLGSALGADPQSVDRSAPLVKRGVIFPQIFIDFELAVCRLCLREADYVVCSNYSWPRVYTDIYIYISLK